MTDARHSQTGERMIDRAGRSASLASMCALAACLAAPATAMWALVPGRATAEPQNGRQGSPPRAAGFQIAAQLDHGAYDIAGAPNVIVHVPRGFDRRAPLQLVVFLHGYSGCVSVLMGHGPARCRPGAAEVEGWDLGRYHDNAGTNTLLVVPQLAYLKRDGRPGRFGQQAGFRAFLEELLAGPLAGLLGGVRCVNDIQRIDLVAHSAGYQTALAILERGGVDPALIRGVVLLDALYGEAPRFARYLQKQAKYLQFIDISLPFGVPARESRWLQRKLIRSFGAEHVTSVDPNGIASAISRFKFVFADGRPPHRQMPATHLTEVLEALHRPRSR